MKIGIDGRFWSQKSGGLGRYSRELVENLLKIDKQNQYFLILITEDFLKCRVRAENLKKIKVSSSHYTLGEQFILPSEIKKYNFDLIHFLNFNHPIFWPGKFIVTIHDLTLLFFPSLKGNSVIKKWAMKVVLNNAFRKAEKIIVPSQATKKDIIKKFKIQNSPPKGGPPLAEKIQVIYEGSPQKVKKYSKSEIAKFRAKNNLLKPYFLYLGQWRPHKNLIRLVKAFEILKNKGREIKLVIGGAPNLKYDELVDKIKKSPYREDISCPGFIPETELGLWYQAAVAFVFPSLYEGFGLPSLEAEVFGCPVLSSKTSCLPEILGDSVLYFNPRNSQDLAQKMERILKDKKLRQGLIKKGSQQIKKYSWQKTARKTLNLYKDILK